MCRSFLRLEASRREDSFSDEPADIQENWRQCKFVTDIRLGLALASNVKCTVISTPRYYRLSSSTYRLSDVYIQKLILPSVINKFYRKLCADVCLLLTAKINRVTENSDCLSS